MLRLILLLIISAWKTTAQLNLCVNEDITGVGLCTLTENYDKSYPSIRPMDLEQIVTIFDIVEFDQDERTVTLFLQLMTYWNDTRITLKSSDPSKYVTM